MSPELLYGFPYNGKSADLFATGAILFILVTGFPPFHKAELRDYFYKFIAANRAEDFWNLHQKNLPADLSKEFKSLFIALI